jgi:hypothetical protein
LSFSRKTHPGILSFSSMNKAIQILTAAALFAGCQSGAPDELNNVVPLEQQKKVYRELRSAMKQSGVEALAAFPQTGMPEGGAEEFRDLQDSLRLTYWALVCDTNHVAANYGDSIWTKGVKEKWPAVVKEGN